MRPYLVLSMLVLLSVAVLGQSPLPYSGFCYYGCGPFVPRLTTPEVSLQTFSPNPVGATNATTGLIAGATNSTLSQIQGSTSSESTVAVWYQGGDAPLLSREINLWPERVVSREGRIMHEGRPSEARPREVHPGEMHPREERSREEHARHAEEARGDWTYITGPAAVASEFKKADHVYGNGDVTRQNDKNGVVKYDGKTVKI